MTQFVPQSNKRWAGVLANIALFRPAQSTSVVMFRTDTGTAGQQCRFEACWILYDGWLRWADYIAVLIKAALQSTWLGVDLENAAVFKRKTALCVKKNNVPLKTLPHLSSTESHICPLQFRFCKGKQAKYNAQTKT